MEKVLGLNVEYQHLSYDGSILGMTSFTEMGVQVFEDDDNEAFFFLDGKTVLVEKDLNFDSKLKGRKNFTLMHEGSHLHFCFIPVEEDLKHEQGYKICANDVLDRRELRNFHPDLQRYLDEHGLEDAHVMTGVTKRQGGNRTVAQLKAEREQEYQQEVERPALYFGESKMEQGLHF